MLKQSHLGLVQQDPQAFGTFVLNYLPLIIKNKITVQQPFTIYIIIMERPGSMLQARQLHILILMSTKIYNRQLKNGKVHLRNSAG